MRMIKMGCVAALAIWCGMAAGQTADQGLLTLTPQETRIVVPEGVPDAKVTQAAETLREWLLKATGAEVGFDIVSEGKAAATPPKVIVAVGTTQWTDPKEIAALWQDGYALRRKGNIITIVGGRPRGTFFGAIGFLDKFCGVRFYMPGDLYTSLPVDKKIAVGAVNLTEEPYVKATSMSGMNAVPGEDVWLLRNAGYTRDGLAGTHQHNMWNTFPPSRFAGKYPEIYPIIKGQRYIPKDSKDQGWQPCLTEPKLLEASEEVVTEYYQKNPNHLWYSLGLQDSHAVCECPRCAAAYEAYKTAHPEDKEYLLKAYSGMYWKFMNELAGRIEKKLPGKRIEGLGYAMTRVPPPFKLHPGIVVFTNLHVAELEADGILKPNAQGATQVDEWLNVVSAYGNHDWYEGDMYLMPRIYSGYWSQYMRHIKSKVPVTYQHAEGYPNWGMDGPKMYILGRIWWNPGVDPNALLKQFCTDMFGPAAQPMNDYFGKLEALWVVLDNIEGPERKMNRWATQFKTSDKDRAEIKSCRMLLDKALTLARTDEQKKRIDLFSRSFQWSEYLFEFTAAEQVAEARVQEATRFAQEKILPDPMTLFPNMRKPEVVAAAIKGAIGKKTIVK